MTVDAGPRAMMREWTWRAGSEAAAHHVRAWWYLVYTTVGFIFFVLFFALGLDLKSAPLLLVSILPGVGIFVCIVLNFVELRRQYSATCTALGLPKGSRSAHFPNLNSQYVAFCGRKGVKAYPFKPKEDVGGQR